MPPKVGQYVVYAFQPPKELVYARIHDVRDDKVDLQLRNDFIITVVYDSNRFQQIPNSLVKDAKSIVQKDDLASVKTWLKTIGNASAAAGAAAAPGLYGGAALMNGLATIGGVVGGSAVTGIVCVAALPAALAGKGLKTLINRCENDTVSKDVAVAGMCAGGIVSAAGVVTAVAGSGSVVGLSGAGITSGLAALGGGSLAAGGWGMAGGLTVLCGWACFPVVAIGGAAWGVTHLIREEIIDNRYETFVKTWKIEGYTGPV